MGETITQIGRYEISRQLVDSALASVYDAFDPVERKPVAIRVPRTTQTHGIGALSLGLKHPNLMTVLSYGENQGEAFQVLEPFAGKPLDIPEGRKLEPAEALPLLRQLASALDYAHAHGAIHGSLHPSSILRNERNEIKVLDLGPVDLAGRNATPEQLLKAVHYLSPEFIREQPLDGRSDQFSLAVLAHRMLTGELPFPGSAMGVMFRIGFQGLERDSIRELPAPAQIAFQRSLAKSPSERYSTCTEMLDALENALIRKPLAATRLADNSAFLPQGAPIAIHAPKRSNQALKYFGITFVAVAVILGSIFYFLLPKPPQPVIQPAAQEVIQPAAPPKPVAPLKAPGLSPAPPVAAPVKPKVKNRGAAKKKPEPEVQVKPVEPKIIRP